MNADVQITIIGAGVIGLAVASQLTDYSNNIVVIERNKRFGEETSSRNSEVIHSGIYYPEGSLKAKLCVQGRDMLYDLCDRENLPYKKCGKLIVATSEGEVQQLDVLHGKAIKNGVNDLEFMDETQIQKMEPHIVALKGLYSPSTGIIDSHSLMQHFERRCKERGVDFAYSSEVSDIDLVKDTYRISTVDSTGDEFSFTSSFVINSAGLESDKIAQMPGIHDPNYKIHFCKGEYFSIKPPKNKLINHLIYPVPFKKLIGLGVHATVDLDGGLRLGPNATYMDENNYDYSIDESLKIDFLESAKRFMPFLEIDDLNPDYAGIRPKIQAMGEGVKDFIIRNETSRGFNNFINLIGIESPGLTACLAIAKYVSDLIEFPLEKNKL